MKDYLLEIVSGRTGYNNKLNAMREYLQAYLLRSLNDAGFFRSAAFVGGTALRFLFDLPRFSEDLDFSLENKSGKYSFINIVNKMKNEFILAGYAVSVTYEDNKTVQNAFFRFTGLMHEAGLSPMKDQKLSIKMEIDTNPPRGAVLETYIVNKYFPISFLSYDPGSLFSGKIHAVLCRNYVKGRDYFDLGWYLSKWKGLKPNFILLNNALKQTGWNKDFPDENNWRVLLGDVVRNTDWKKVNKDVENFLENQTSANVFTRENLLKLIDSAS